MKYLIIILSILVFTSCEKALFKPDMASSDPLENFDYLWNEVDKKYSYFELKDINWDEMKNTYRPMLNENSSEMELFDVLASMLNELKDDHTNLISPFNVSAYNVALNNPKNYRARTIDEFYLTDPWRTGSLKHDFLSNGEIAYIRYGSFSSGFSDAQMDLVLTRYSNTKGIILDLRENGGGAIFNIPKLLGRFVESKTLVGHSITRDGENHSDFGEKEDFYIAPHGNVQYLKPVVVLIDKGSYSATTFFAVATKAFPNIKLIGDATGGGGGLPNGGQLPNGWTYRFSVSQLLDLNGNNYAENGVPADIETSFDWTDLETDEILERGILELE
ncbi:S41 family peptidase [Brumimicrobium oceani]|uniref:Peptidase S41 n=1 Tax=Brumimicrobium oceani TaxID=2100725 RepID=A0A2U2X3C6_9FLAO|nr:S41 family peptidase [Brumimicrobium oceani]PWH82254.1 peptidase S41 [Brumimicrobium oceani]